MPCLDDRAVHAWIGGELPETERDVVRTHLDRCDSCRELIASAIEGQWIGQSAGRYRLAELIGAGAMGEVYRAEDPELGRNIAIKIVHPGGSEKRLLREAQVMARLEHANVIRIYDVGMFGDRVFLAMELVKGRTLRAWFGTSRSWREVIATVKQAGSGLAAAHVAGLVHGDFKPDNVLVADDGRVLVTDFGLARLATETSQPAAVGDAALAQTQTRGVAGTPAYMAPEQLAETAGASAASDQFGFCVTLFEGLYGMRPFRGSDVAALRAAQATALELPARPVLPGRVTRVLRRGLSASATDRYPAMPELLADLDRALSKRRTMAAVGGGVLGCGAIAAALLLRSAGGPACDGTAELDGVWDAAARARLEHAFGASALPYATTSFASVGQLLDRYRDAWTATFTETCEATQRGAQSEALLDLRMQCLQRRRHELKAVVDTLGAGGRDVLRDAVVAVSALPSVRDCADVASLQEIQALPTDPEARRRVEVLETENARCRSLLAAGKFDQATTCSTAAAKTGDELKHGPAIADAELTAGITATRLRKWTDAEAAMTRALLAAETSRDARTRARVLTGLVSIAGERAAFAQGRERAVHAAALIKGLDDDKELAADLAMAAGVLALREGKLDVAIETLERCVALREESYGKDDVRVAEPLVPLAVAHANRGKTDDAKQLLDRAIAIDLARRGEGHPAIGKTLHSLAQIQARVGQTDAALASQQRSYDILKAAYGEKHQDVAMSVGAAAQINLIAGRYDAAVPFARQSAELMEAIAGPEHPDTAVALATLAATLSRKGDTDGALAAHQRALAIRLKALGPTHLHTTQSQVSTAMALRTKKRCAEALPLLEAARDVRIEQLGTDSPEVARTLQSIADCQIDLDRAAEAVPSLERVLAIYDKTPRRSADDKVTYAMATYGLARALWATPDKPLDRVRATTLAKRAHAELVALKDKRAEGIATWAKPRRVAL